METIAMILVLTAALATLIKVLGKRVAWLKPWCGRMSVTVAVVGVLSAIVAFWLTDKPATISETQEIVQTGDDSLHRHFDAKFDELNERLMLSLEIEEDDSTYREENRKLAGRLRSVARTVLEKGMVAIGLEDYDEALELLYIALKAAEDDTAQMSTVYFDIGFVHDKLGHFQEAIGSYDSALAYEPDFSHSWYNRGISQVNLGYFTEGIVSFDSALTLNPHLYQAWFNRGHTLSKLKRYDEAIASYSSALALKPDYQRAFYNRGTAQAKAQYYTEAVASLDMAISLKSDDHQAWYNRGNALGYLGRYEESILSYRAALAHEPDKPIAWRSCGASFALLSMYDSALTCFDSALKYEPDDSVTLELRKHTIKNINQ